MRTATFFAGAQERVPYQVFIKDGIFVNHKGKPWETKDMYSNYSKVMHSHASSTYLQHPYHDDT